MAESWGECYYDQYDKFLRNLVGRNIFQKDDHSPSIQMLEYDGVFSGCRVFASLGLSHYSDELGQVGEIVVPVDAGWDDVSSVVANALFYMIQHKMSLGWGMAIKGIENVNPGFARTYQKDALYFTHTFGLPEEFAEVVCDDEKGRLY